MKLPIYTDLIIKYEQPKQLERSWRIPVDNSIPRFIDVSGMLEHLYKDKLISYIRTDTAVLPIEHFDERFDILDSIANSNYYNKDIMNLLIKIDINHMKPEYWVDNFSFAHHAITPTAHSEDARHYFNSRIRPYDVVREVIYTDICKSYINLFIPD